MPRSAAALVSEPLEDADAGTLDPLCPVYVERQDGSLEYLQVEPAEGWHLRALLGFTVRRVLVDGPADEEYHPAGDWGTPETWCYLPAPIDWPATSRAALACWVIDQTQQASSLSPSSLRCRKVQRPGLTPRSGAASGVRRTEAAAIHRPRLPGRRRPPEPRRSGDPRRRSNTGAGRSPA